MGVETESGVSVVVPVFGTGEGLGELARRVGETLGKTRHEIILVDDGNAPATWRGIEQLARSGPSVRGIRLGRNVGQHAALLAGIESARFEIVVTMDDDLQHPPEEIPALLARLSEEYDVVYGVPERVERGPLRRTASRLARSAFAVGLGIPSAANLTSFRAFRTQVRDGFSRSHGRSVSLDALLAWSTERFAEARVEHHAREFGRSNYGPRRLIRFAFDTATSYSTRPLRLATYLGLSAAMIGTILLAGVFVQLLAGATAPSGFRFLASTVVLFSGVQLLMLGVIGEYLGRMHYRVMDSPPYRVVQTTEQAGS